MSTVFAQSETFFLFLIILPPLFLFTFSFISPVLSFFHSTILYCLSLFSFAASSFFCHFHFLFQLLLSFSLAHTHISFLLLPFSQIQKDIIFHHSHCFRSLCFFSLHSNMYYFHCGCVVLTYISKLNYSPLTIIFKNFDVINFALD